VRDVRSTQSICNSLRSYSTQKPHLCTKEDSEEQQDEENPGNKKSEDEGYVHSPGCEDVRISEEREE